MIVRYFHSHQLSLYMHPLKVADEQFHRSHVLLLRLVATPRPYYIYQFEHYNPVTTVRHLYGHPHMLFVDGLFDMFCLCQYRLDQRNCQVET